MLTKNDLLEAISKYTGLITKDEWFNDPLVWTEKCYTISKNKKCVESHLNTVREYIKNNSIIGIPEDFPGVDTIMDTGNLVFTFMKVETPTTRKTVEIKGENYHIYFE